MYCIYQMTECQKNMSYKECELFLATQTAEKALYNQGKAETSSELMLKLTQMCEDFIRRSKTVVYGGTAINAILPKAAKFYNPETEIPDYDMYSPTPIEHAKEMVEEFIKAGFEHVEAKSALHYGTYKVFVNFVGALDITFMPPKLFKVVQNNALKRDGMLFCHPDLLRQAIYIELANPEGDVGRWKKVLPRLYLLNEAFPIEAGTCKDLHVNIQSEPIDNNLKRTLEKVMLKEKVVFLGGLAHSYYMPPMSPSVKDETPGYYDIIADNTPSFIQLVFTELKNEGFTKLKKLKHPAVGELMGPYYEVKVDNITVLNVFEPTRCYAYNELSRNGEKVRVASFDTLLAFYFGFLYADLPHFNKKRILCMAEMLFKAMHENVYNQKGVLKRFPLQCYGTSDNLRTMRAHKWNIRKKLKKGTVAYNRWFFNYKPHMKSPPSSSN